MGKFLLFMRDSEFDKSCHIVHKFVDKIVYKVLEKTQPKDAEKVIEGKEDADRYVFLTEMAKATRDPKQLRDELLNILLAGRDTTASLLSVTFHVLAHRPDIFKKLKAEVDELHGVKPDYETLKTMKYLKYLLNESKSPLPQRSNITDTSSPSPLPRRPGKRPIRQQKYYNTPRWRARRPKPHLHPQGSNCRIRRLRYASPERHLWA